MKIHSTVLVILHSPREKVWGQLLDLNPAGVTIHGLDLNAFDEWLKQWGSEEESGLTTVFYPLHRVERMELDEPVGDLARGRHVHGVHDAVLGTVVAGAGHERRELDGGGR